MGNSPLHSTLVRVFVDGVAAGAGVRRANLRFEPALAASWVAQVQSGVALAMKQVEQVRRWQLAASRAPNVSAREVRNLTSQCTGPGLAAASSASKWACSVALRKRMPGPVTASVRLLWGSVYSLLLLVVQVRLGGYLRGMMYGQ